MNNPAFIVPLGILSFAALWFGVIKLTSFLGWRRLATHYQVDQVPTGARRLLSLAYVRFLQYQSVIRAGAFAEGLVLTVLFPFRVGHPPLLIPWQAIGPVYCTKNWLRSIYSITISTDGTSSVEFKFTDKSFLEELRPRLLVIDLH
jgi:hypothetical protein